MSDVYWIFFAACVGWCVFQLLYTRSHRRNLERHTEEMKRIYRDR